MRRFAILLAALAVCAGCSYAGRPTVEFPGLAPGRGPVTEEEIQRVLEMRAELALPANLAIARVSKTPDELWDLEAPDEEEKEGWSKVFGDESRFTTLAYISDLLMTKAELDMRSLRYAAAQLHAELLLIYVVEDDAAFRPNLLSPLYLTIVGALFVPGTIYENYAVARACLVDVRTGFIFLVAGGEHKAQIRRPTAWKENFQLHVKQEAESRSLEKLREDVARSLSAALKRFAST